MIERIRKEEIAELKAKFAALLESREIRDFLSKLNLYLHFIEESAALNALARRIMTDNPSPAARNMAKMLVALRKMWEKDYNPNVETVLADAYSSFSGSSAKYDIPLIFADLETAKSVARMFHGEVIHAASDRRPYFQRFDATRGVLIFGEKEILIGRMEGAESNSVRLMATLAKDPFRLWGNDEIHDDWGEHTVTAPKGRFYNAAYKLNKTIAIKTGVEDFILVTSMTARINPTYLKQK